MDTGSLKATPSMSSRQKDKIFLIGYACHQITGSKLPSNCQVLRSLFYNMRYVKLNLRDAARLTIQEVLLFWQKSNIQTRHLKDCIDKLENLYEQWRKLQKNASRATSEAQKTKVEAFKLIFDDLFDVAHQDALIKSAKEDREFLLLQRQKGRPGCMGGVDMNFVRAVERREKRRSDEMARLSQSQHMGEMQVCLRFIENLFFCERLMIF